MGECAFLPQYEEDLMKVIYREKEPGFIKLMTEALAQAKKEGTEIVRFELSPGEFEEFRAEANNVCWHMTIIPGDTVEIMGIPVVVKQDGPQADPTPESEGIETINEFMDRILAEGLEKSKVHIRRYGSE